MEGVFFSNRGGSEIYKNPNGKNDSFQSRRRTIQSNPVNPKLIAFNFNNNKCQKYVNNYILLFQFYCFQDKCSPLLFPSNKNCKIEENAEGSVLLRVGYVVDLFDMFIIHTCFYFDCSYLFVNLF
jgi:hypothetical protein